MLTNKWIQFSLSALVALLGFAASTDWTSLFSVKTAGGIVTGVGIVKMILNAFAPATGTIVQPTTSSIVTHTSVPAATNG